MDKLTGAQVSELAKALSTTVNLDDLGNFVYVATGDQLEVYWTDVAKPLVSVLRELVIRLEQEGQTGNFLKAIYVDRPRRDDIRQLIARLAPEAAAETLTNPYDLVVLDKDNRGTQPSAATLGPGLQRNIKPHLRMLDPASWIAGMNGTLRRVCRIEIDGSPAGTGFLVGPRAVLTNWHVVEAVAGQNGLSAVSCRFDYARKADGSFNEGEAAALSGTGLLHHRPYAPAEMTAAPDEPPPSATELDFALLELAGNTGTERGWFALPDRDDALGQGSPLIIAQHPHGGPIKLAIDTEAILPTPAPPGRPRLRYATNTDPGSSGSPCLSMEWQLLALHHFGDPAWGEPTFNQGVPAGLIRADIEAAGLGATIPAA
ncbi:trypsin-like peptidase domain-containing protein [Labrys sp. LIt4]|uniref:trypsin-like peptidase domain-containing protein n=1 Tax=Labrys sp. LIt4 TaxID=2821355 RepID=UPI001ADF298D|nr:trypsin-like peptidase domain-containing protein [Labrys sp. LIt4]